VSHTSSALATTINAELGTRREKPVWFCEFCVSALNVVLESNRSAEEFLMNWIRLPLIAMCAAVSAGAGESAQIPLQIDHVANRTADRATDPHDHRSALAQLDASRASHVAARSGDWSDPGTWASRVPTAGARVVIPQGVTVTVTVPIAVEALDWVRVEGRLHFSPFDNSQLSVTTLLVTPAGTLSIGAPDSPVDSGKTVRLLFAPRSPTVRRQDSVDMLGGLIALGRVYI
jgi:G8 domain